MFETVGLMALNYGKTIATHPATRAAVCAAHTALIGAVTYQNAAETYRSGKETGQAMKGLVSHARAGARNNQEPTFVAGSEGMSRAA